MKVEAIERFAPLSVLMVLPKYPDPVVGGLERQAFELSRKLVKEHGVKVHVLSTRFDALHKSYDVVDGVEITRVRWSNFRWLRFALLPFQVAQVIWKMRKATDVVHVHQHSAFGLFAIAVSRMFSLPVLAKLPNYGEYGIPGMKQGLFGRLSVAIFLRANAFVAMSVQSIDELLQVHVSRSQILTIPNGITPSKSRLIKQKPNSATSSSHCRVTFVGRINAEKRLDVLLEAWHSIVDQIRDRATLEIWGDGPQRVELEYWCVQRNLSDSIKWRGHVANVRSELEDVDVFALPSSNEGNSNAILEAMVAGLPIVATPVGGTQIQLGKSGEQFLVAVGDVDALAAKLLFLINNPQIRYEYGNSLHQRALKHFDIAKIAKGYLCSYKLLALVQNPDLTNCSSLPNN